MRVQVTMTTTYDDGMTVEEVETFDSWEPAFAFIAGTAACDWREMVKLGGVPYTERRFDISEVPA